MQVETTLSRWIVRDPRRRGQVLGFTTLRGYEPPRHQQPRGAAQPGSVRRSRRRRPSATGFVFAAKPSYCLPQAEPLGTLREVQHVAGGTAAETVEALGVGVHREAALALVVKGTDALAYPAPSPEPDARSLHTPPSRCRPLTASRSTLALARTMIDTLSGAETPAGCGGRPACPAAIASPAPRRLPAHRRRWE